MIAFLIGVCITILSGLGLPVIGAMLSDEPWTVDMAAVTMLIGGAAGLLAYLVWLVNAGHIGLVGLAP